LSECKECTRNSISSSMIREVSQEKTLTELLNTLLAQQGVLEREVSKRELISLRGEKGTGIFEVRVVEAQGGKQSC
jgi:hypothetical protein